MKTHLYLFLATITLLFTGCNSLEQANEYLDHQNDIMKWYNSTNSQLLALQSIVKAIEEEDVVKAVTALENGNGYTVIFGKNKPVNIQDIKTVDGDVEEAAITPLIGAALFTDNNYYWTLKIGSANPTWLLDKKGNKIRTNGTAQQEGTLKVMIALSSDNNYYWQINGEWLMVNNAFVPATLTQSIVVFAEDGIDSEDEEYVTITLANGTTLTLPKYQFFPFADATDPITIEEPSLTIPLALPNDVTESNYGSIKAKMIANDPTDPDESTTKTEEEEPMWEISVNDPTFIDGEYQNDASVTIKPIVGKLTVGDIATLEVSLIDSDGISTTASTDIHVGAIATVDEDTHTLTLVTKGSLTEDLIGQAVGDSKTLIINGLLSGDYDEDAINAEGEWILLRTTLRKDAYNELNLTMNHVVAVTTLSFWQTKIASITMPEATIIGKVAFLECSALTTIELPKATNIKGNAFSRCTALTTVEIPKATEIGAYAFQYCIPLTTVELPKATEIGIAAFLGCQKLITITIPNATNIGKQAFFNCYKLTTIELPKATEIGDSAFSYCYALTTVDLPMATEIGDWAFQYCSALTTVKLPKATNIGNYAFITCKKLTTVELPMATDIGKNAFFLCEALTTIELPKATDIGANAFHQCAALTTVELPKATKIGGMAFYDCDALTTLKLAATGAISEFGTNVFMSTDTSKIDLFLGSAEITAQSVTTGANQIWRGNTFKSIAQFVVNN